MVGKSPETLQPMSVNQLPKVSVIIACHNCAPYIDECLNSIYNQTYKGKIEIIICDDCSTDNSQELLKNYEADGKIKLILNETNLGAGESRNRCIKASSGSMIAILDADDYSSLDRLEKQVAVLCNNNKIDFVSGGLRKFFDDGSEYNLRSAISMPVAKDFLYGLPFLHAATLFRRSILERVNGYRIAPETKRGQDYDLFMRIYAIGGIGINIPDIVYHYRCFKSTKARTKFKFRIDEAIIRYKGFKALGINSFIATPYIIKPIIAGFTPEFLLQKYLKWRANR